MDRKNFCCDIIEVPGARNFRDIGGYIGSGGKAVAKGRFFRAGALDALTGGGVEKIRKLNVGCVIDLRSGQEIAASPDILANDKNIDYVHIPLLDYIHSCIMGGSTDFPETLEEIYVGLLEDDKESFLKLLRTCANPDYKGVIFHCTAGKDRTGISAMLLLGLAGVSERVITEDYCYSEQLLDSESSRYPDLPEYLFHSRPEPIGAALSHVGQKYGGVREYARQIGLSSESEGRLLKKLLG